MSLLYQAKQVKFSNGEVSGLLLDAEGLPLPEPALWVMRKLRVKNAANTILSKLRAVAVLYSWLDKLEAEKKGRGNKGSIYEERLFQSKRISSFSSQCNQ